MSGSLYIGSQKVCPAVVLGQPEPPDYDILYKIPDSVTELIYVEMAGVRVIGNTYRVLLDLNNVEKVLGGPLYHFAAISGIGRLSIKADKLKECGRRGMSTITVSGSPTPTYFYNPILKFPNLEIIGPDGFSYFVGRGLTDIYFSKVKTIDVNGLRSMLSNMLDPITLHFPSNQESLISSLSEYPTFDGRNQVTILYDQPATE